jgi:transcription-repair coupling factor (superfamily II helicase)
VAVRLNLYHRLADIKNEEELNNLKMEFSDRFGTLPAEVNNLLFSVNIKIKAGRAGVKSIVSEDERIVVRLVDGLQLEKQKTEMLPKAGITMGRTQLNIEYKKLGKDWVKSLEQILDIIKLT